MIYNSKFLIKLILIISCALATNINAFAIDIAVMDTIPVHSKIIIKKKSMDKEIDLSIENGEVQSLKIDGREIDKSEYDSYSDIIDQAKEKDKGFYYNFENDNNLGLGFNFNFDSQKFNDQFNNFDFEGFDFNTFIDKIRSKNDGFFNMDSLFNGKFYFFSDSIKNFGLGPNDFQFSLPDFERSYELERVIPESKNFTDVLGAELNYDGLLIPNKSNKVELSGKHLKINGEKQPTNIWLKYKRIFEQESGTVLEKNSKLDFTFEGKPSKRILRSY